MYLILILLCSFNKEYEYFQLMTVRLTFLYRPTTLGVTLQVQAAQDSTATTSIPPAFCGAAVNRAQKGFSRGGIDLKADLGIQPGQIYTYCITNKQQGHSHQCTLWPLSGMLTCCEWCIKTPTYFMGHLGLEITECR